MSFQTLVFQLGFGVDVVRKKCDRLGLEVVDARALGLLLLLFCSKY